MKNPHAKRGFLVGSRRTLLLFDFGLTFISNSPDSTGGAKEAGGPVIAVVPMAVEIESKGRSFRETGKEGLRRGGRTVGIVGAAREVADWAFEIVGVRACLVGKGVNTGDGGLDSGSVLDPLES